MAVTVSDRLLTVGRGRDREGLMPAIAGRDRDRQESNPVAGRPGLVPISQPRQHCFQHLDQANELLITSFSVASRCATRSDWPAGA